MLEGLRYQDLIRWKVAKKALDKKLIGLPNPIDQNRNQWPFTNVILPDVDKDGVVVFNADALIAGNPKRCERLGGMAHGLPVGLASHDDGDGGGHDSDSLQESKSIGRL